MKTPSTGCGTTICSSRMLPGGRSQCGISDIHRVVQADMLCDQFGLDTISAGVTIGWTMECVQRGLLGAGQLDGLDVRFGRADVVPVLLRKMAMREGVGAILADGVEAAREHFGILWRTFPGALKPDWLFWLLGAAFLLIEFTSITRLALLFGTTWLVNALAISGVLLMILVANLIVLNTQRINIRLCYGLLFASMALVYFFPFESLNALAVIPRGISSVGLLSLPLLFSGLIFGESLRRLGRASGALASNLSGSVAGGILEYSSLWWGVQSLYLIGGLVYLMAMLVYLRQKR